ncbi:MAG: N-acetyltransferase [Alphaproteobacteria bacterium]|nr:N-acetyltransferase [Alphaproteobacteria bacterium]
MTIRLEAPQDALLVEALLDRSFGPGRERKTSYRLRDGVSPVAALCFVNTLADGTVAATLRFWPIAIGAARMPALLLGPLAVEPGLQGLGYGKALMRHGLAAARSQGHRIVVLVGDPEYYEPFGFTRALTMNLAMPGPTEAHRFLAHELVPGALDGVHGTIGRALPARRMAGWADPTMPFGFAFAEP